MNVLENKPNTGLNMKTRNINSKEVDEYQLRLHAYRTSATTFPEFFAGMSEILKDMFNVDLVINQTPTRVRYLSSTHDSPIGKPQAWTNEQKANPDIPNEYIGVSGIVEGTVTVPEDFEYDKTEFECMRLFWSFGFLNMEFLHGTPNGSKHKWDGNTETFSVDFKLFLEDFPALYREYRLDDNIEHANTELSAALKSYQKHTRDTINTAKNEDEILIDIQEQIERLTASRQILDDLKQKRQKFVTDQVHKNLPPLPKIENKYLDLTEYHRMTKTYKVADLPKPDAEAIFKKVTNSLKKFNTYCDEYVEDFL